MIGASEENAGKRILKQLLTATIYREGAVRGILAGPGRGIRYRVFSGYGLSPILGGWEREAQELMVKHIGPDAVVYDVGANYGIHTLLMARLAGKGHVYAFEPASEISSSLEENLRLNKIANVTPVPLAVSDVTGVATFSTGHHHGASHLDNAALVSDQTVSVRTTSLDEFAYREGNQAPDFIKIDVEGGESKVLAGATRVLKEAKPIILVDLHNPDQDLAVGKIFSGHNYSAFRTENDEHVKRLDRGWPDPSGLWGQIIAFPPPR